MNSPRFSARWQDWRARVDLDEYEFRWHRLAAEGHHVHGEADFIAALKPRSVLDAGCGMGRVGIELANRAIEVEGVDLDPDLLGRARKARPDLVWHSADLATLDLGRTFDVVALAGNVLLFVEPDDQSTVITAAARHLRVGSHLVAGFSVDADMRAADDYLEWCSDAGLVEI